MYFKEVSFCHPFKASTMGADVFEIVNYLFEAEGLEGKNLCGCTTVGPPAMLGGQPGLNIKIKPVKAGKTYALHCAKADSSF